MKIKVTLGSLLEVSARLRGIKERVGARDMAPLPRTLGRFQARRVKDRMLQGKLKNLPPYKKKTLEIRRRAGHRRPLVRKGDLAKSIRILKANGRSATYGTTHPKARLLNRGGTENGRELRAFPFLDPTEEDLKLMAEIVADQIIPEETDA